MDLIECPECKKIISPNMKNCPNCGIELNVNNTSTTANINDSGNFSNNNGSIVIINNDSDKKQSKIKNKHMHQAMYFILGSLLGIIITGCVSYSFITHKYNKLSNDNELMESELLQINTKFNNIESENELLKNKIKQYESELSNIDKLNSSNQSSINDVSVRVSGDVDTMEELFPSSHDPLLGSDAVEIVDFDYYNSHLVYNIMNNSGYDFTSLGLSVTLLDDEENILDSTIGWVNSKIPNGKKAKLEIRYDKSIKATYAKIDCFLYDTDGDGNVLQTYFTQEQSEKSIITIK